MGAGKHLSEGSMPLVAAGQLFLHRHPELGGSTYDYHADGRGTHHSSRLRPLLNIRPEAPFWALTGFPADTHVTAWLEHSGERFDVLTDEDLHHEGPSVLHPYRVVVTGTHPEYYSTAMLDALDAYLDHGGRLMYLGGNGFYWRIGFPEANPGVIEVRRGEHGTGAWHDEPGEDTLASTGEPAGLWARNRRPPHALVGVGFAAQGFDSAAPYRVRRSARRSRAAWILAGVDDDVIGDHGAIGGGAAGWEIDRADPAHGTPAHAVVLASSFGHTATYRHVIEELPLNLGLADGIQDPNVRSDVVFFETPRGGAVFSVGSMTWATSLADRGYDNAVCTITDNVLRRFVDPEPFPAPTPP
jgi:N,N-dimethylformamidase